MQQLQGGDPVVIVVVEVAAEVGGGGATGSGSGSGGAAGWFATAEIKAMLVSIVRVR
jgi:hypothetical protein